MSATEQDRAHSGPLAQLVDPVVELFPSASFREAAAAMADSGCSCVVVGEHSPPWIVTEHDLAGGLAAGMDPDMPAQTLATRAPVWVTLATTLPQAVATMVEHRVRHVVVITEEGMPLGTVSLVAAVRALLGAATSSDASSR